MVGVASKAYTVGVRVLNPGGRPPELGARRDGWERSSGFCCSPSVPARIGEAGHVVDVSSWKSTTEMFLEFGCGLFYETSAKLGHMFAWRVLMGSPKINSRINVFLL